MAYAGVSHNLKSSIFEKTTWSVYVLTLASIKNLDTDYSMKKESFGLPLALPLLKELNVTCSITKPKLTNKKKNVYISSFACIL